MISESHSDWNRSPLKLQPALPLEVVGELPVVHDGDVGERIRPVRVGAGDVHVGLGRHPDVADRVGALEPAELVQIGHLLRVAEVLHDLQRMAEREHLAPGHVLQVVGQRLHVAVVADHRSVGVLGLALHPVDRGADLVQPSLDLLTGALQALLEVEVPRVVRVGQLEPDHHELLGLSVQRVPRESGPRCFMDWSMLVISVPMSAEPSRWMMPAMPHM